MPDFDIFTSIPACQYSKNGYNDTLVFHADNAGNLNGIQFDVIDYQYLATLEKHPKKRRLMSTRQYEIFDTKSNLSPIVEGTRPIFNKYKYDSLGKEMKEKLPKGEQPEEEQSFLRKYWLYILLAAMILPNLLGSADEGAQGQGGAPAPAGRKWINVN